MKTSKQNAIAQIKSQYIAELRSLLEAIRPIVESQLQVPTIAFTDNDCVWREFNLKEDDLYNLNLSWFLSVEDLAEILDSTEVVVGLYSVNMIIFKRCL